MRILKHALVAVCSLAVFSARAATGGTGGAAPAPTGKLAVDSAKCEISYHDMKNERGLDRKCAARTSAYFSLDDKSAPLVEAKTFRIGKTTFLATRWATGQSEEVLLFDLSKDQSTIVNRVISSGPSSIALDANKNKIRVQITERDGSDLTARASMKTLLWPASH